jgi:phosphoglycolate phosphatase
MGSIYKAIIFDFDDTLVATRISKREQFKETARRFYDFELEDKIIDEHWGKAFNELMTELFGRSSDSIENIIENYFSLSKEFPMMATKGAKDLIEKFHKTIPLGILTASNRRAVLEDLERLKIYPHYFNHIQTSEDTIVHKPDPLVFQPILRAFTGIDTKNILYIGDSTSDFLAATEGGLNFIGVTTGRTTAKEFVERGIEYYPDLDAISKIISPELT